jgi:phosphoribosylanthranilate isomerase
MIPVKVCGITRVDDARLAVSLGASAIGLVFWPKSPRVVSAAQAREIVASLPPFVTAVGVFVDAPPADVRAIVEAVGLDIAQLHGDENVDEWASYPGPVIKAVTVRTCESTPWRGRARALLLDADDRTRRGGTGQAVDWHAARTCAAAGPVVLAGGLRADNVGEAIRVVQPAALDVSSGVESAPGRKEADRLEAFFAAVRHACARREDGAHVTGDRR